MKIEVNIVLTDNEHAQESRQHRESIIRRKYFYILFSIVLISLLSLSEGCDEDPELKPDLTKVLWTDPLVGSGLQIGAAVTFGVNKPMADATITGEQGVVEVQGNTIVWTPVKPYPKGTVTLTVNGTDVYGQKLEECTVTYVAGRYGVQPPRIADTKCSPKNGVVDVDPQEYQEKLVIVFEEPLGKAKVISTDPEFSFVEELTGEGNVLEISFLDYIMPYGIEMVILLSATDLAGNEAELTYSFTTMTNN